MSGLPDYPLFRAALPADERAVKELIDEWLEDPKMWATHGLPPDQKLDRIERDVLALVRRLAAR